MEVKELLKDLRIPVIGAPLFTVSYPELVIAQCKAGIVGSFPALKTSISRLFCSSFQVFIPVRKGAFK